MTRLYSTLMTVFLLATMSLSPLGIDLLGASPAVAQSQSQRFWLQAQGDNGSSLTSGRCRILNAGLQTDATIYTDGTLGTAATNPLTLNTTTGQCEFYMSGSAVDVEVWITDGTYKGSLARIYNFGRTSTKNVLFGRGHVMKSITVPMPASASSATVSSGITLPVGAMVTHAVVETTTAGTSSTALVGFSPGAINAICSGASTAAIGVVDCNPTKFLVTSGNNTIAYTPQGHASAGYITVVYHLGSISGP